MYTNPRIISGKLKGIKLDVSDSTRPLTDRVKRTIFDILDSYINDINVLDLFSGSGNFAMESISRGAKYAVLIDRDQKSISAIYNNVKKSKIENQVKIIKSSFEDYLRKSDDKFNLIFIDPPFTIIHKVKLNKVLPLLIKNGLIIIKLPNNERKNYKIPISFEVIKEKNIGINCILFLKIK